MDFDGEGFGFAWYSASFAFGDSIFFSRWSPEGEVLTQPTRLVGGIARPSDIVWTGSAFAVPYDDRADVRLMLVRPDGSISGSSRMIVGGLEASR